MLEKSWKNYIKKQQPNQFRCYNQNMGFVNRMDQNGGGSGGASWLFEWYMLLDVIKCYVRVHGY